eukprot:UN29106
MNMPKKFVDSDDFFKELPTNDLEQLRKSLIPEFEKAYDEKYDEQVGELMKIYKIEIKRSQRPNNIRIRNQR